jgi:hypothetical protein
VQKCAKIFWKKKSIRSLKHFQNLLFSGHLNFFTILNKLNKKRLLHIIFRKMLYFKHHNLDPDANFLEMLDPYPKRNFSWDCLPAGLPHENIE